LKFTQCKITGSTPKSLYIKHIEIL
jgi:hypothetical protein